MKRALEAASIIALASMFVMLAVVYRGIPDQIPNHFNNGAHTMRTIGKGSLWILPIVSTNLFLLLSAASGLAPLRSGIDPTSLIVLKAVIMLGAALLFFVWLP
jgi:hypothetical protein